MLWKWYGVKTIYRTTVRGIPRRVDSVFDPKATLIEERVVVFRARSFDEAIERAEAEARRYAGVKHRNAYGQTVKQRYLGACDAFEMFDSPGPSREVYSQTEVLPESISDTEVLKRRLGNERRRSKVRKKFLNAELRLPTTRLRNPRS